MKKILSGILLILSFGVIARAQDSDVYTGVIGYAFDSIEELKAAASDGEAPAQYQLGKEYYDGKIVKKNYRNAVKWFTKAAEQGHAEAQFMLARCYFSRKGMPNANYRKTKPLAEKWFIAAAEQGHAEAQYQLAKFYYVLEEHNHHEAFKWYTKAAELGHYMAQHALSQYYYEWTSLDHRGVVEYDIAKAKDLKFKAMLGAPEEEKEYYEDQYKSLLFREFCQKAIHQII